jgi:hypothetical protein
MYLAINIARLIRAEELEISGGDQVETDSYFETDYASLTNYFKARGIRRSLNSTGHNHRRRRPYCLPDVD